MISARDELIHLVESLDEAEAEAALECLHRSELIGVKKYPVVRRDGRVVVVTVPED